MSAPWRFCFERSVEIEKQEVNFCYTSVLKITKTRRDFPCFNAMHVYCEVSSQPLPEVPWIYTPRVNDGYLYVNTPASVIIYGLANPTAPAEVSRLDIGALGIDVAGTTVYTASSTGLHFFDISNPASPVERSTVSGDYRAVSVFGDQAFAVATVMCPNPEWPWGEYPCGTAVEQLDVSDPRNPVSVWFGAGGQYVTITSLAQHDNLLLVGTSKAVAALNLSLPDHPIVGRYTAKFDTQFGAVTDVRVIDNVIYAVAHVGDLSSIRILKVGIHVAYLPLTVSTAYAQGPDENRFGIAEADKGSDINWDAQNYRWVWANIWRPEQSNPWRRVYTGPDVIDTWKAAHSPDTYSEGPGHFGPNFAGPVSNGYADPLSDGIDMFWVSANWGDQAFYNAPATLRYTDANGHTYNREYHNIMGAGGHHLHDTNGDEYINCYDIQYFDRNNSIVTCDSINQTGPLDGAWVQDLNVFYDFVAANPGKTWVIGGEHNLPTLFKNDPFMYAIYLRDFSDQIRTRGGNGTKVYLKDVGNLFSSLPYPSQVWNDTFDEPGTDPGKDRGDWWYTVAVHFHNLSGQLDGFVSDAGIGTDDDRYCWDTSDGLHMGLEDSIMVGGLTQQLGLKWAKYFGFSSYNIKWWLARSVHTHGDTDDGATGDDLVTYNTCSAEYGLADYDGGGYRTPRGEVFYHVVDPNLTNYTWWPEGTDWQHSPSGPYCDNVEERYQQRPDQTHDRDSNGNPVDFGDFPSGW